MIGLWWRIVSCFGVHILAGRRFRSCSELSVPVTRGEDSGLVSKHLVTLIIKCECKKYRQNPDELSNSKSVIIQSYQIPQYSHLNNEA